MPQSTTAVAHGPDHALIDHLRAVADLAARNVPEAAREWARLAGLWHDLGKFRPGFQRYVRQDADAHIEGRGVRRREKSHSAAGALYALRLLGKQYGKAGQRAGWLVANLIAAHHAGLYDAADLTERLLGGGRADSERELLEAETCCAAEAPELLMLPRGVDASAIFSTIPGLGEDEPLAQSLWVRMLFSALVDADFIDTEAYFDRDRSQCRSGFPPLSDYMARLDVHLEELAARTRAEGRAGESVIRARELVLADCRAAAELSSGVFSLQVPTGGGKTLASLAFALRHAVKHGLRRVIIAIPYTSIVEQTADVLAGIFGRDAIVEHHSQVDAPSSRETARSRLACENWDAPIILTTNVQFFETLFAARPSRCRKLHNVQRSVVVLDEAQTLPPELLQPTLDVLRLLAGHYGVSVLSCTATQPVLTDIERFDTRKSIRGLVREKNKLRKVIGETALLYEALERTRISWPDDLNTPVEIDTLAARIAIEPAVLAIVNTRRDAADLVRAIDKLSADEVPTLHLSAAMCGQHRADVIATIRRRLGSRRLGDVKPVRVVATQLVEAGVDIDFPVVFRSLAGLDSIAQAAGRCNREGRLGWRGGRVEVFVRPIPAVLTALVRAAQATRSVLGDSRPPVLGPEIFDGYFKSWYAQFEVDEKGILQMLRKSPDFELQFDSAAAAFRMIDEQDQAAVVVPYGIEDDPKSRRLQALAALRDGNADRWHFRSLQRNVVQVRSRNLLAGLAQGDFSEPMPGWFTLNTSQRYSERLGLLMDGAALDVISLVQ